MYQRLRSRSFDMHTPADFLGRNVLKYLGGVGPISLICKYLKDL